LKNFGITTTLKINTEKLDEAQQLAAIMNLPFIPRLQKSIFNLLNENKLEAIYVVGNREDSIENKEGNLKWHPNMTSFKIRDLHLRKSNPMFEAMKLQVGDRVLDCTLGLGGDALFISSFVGKDGLVLGLEGDPLIAKLTERGLKNYFQNEFFLNDAANRIKVMNIRYEDFLNQIYEGHRAFDVIYFDPMFQTNIESSSAMKSVKSFAIGDCLDPSILEKAIRLSRKSVVVKMRRDSVLLKTFKFTGVYGRNRDEDVVYAYYHKSYIKGICPKFN